MQRNVGFLDLAIRSMIGIGTLAYLAKDGAFAQDSGPGIAIAVYLVVTAILTYCPLYQLFGCSTSSPLDRSV